MSESYGFVTLHDVTQHWEQCPLCSHDLVCEIGSTLLDAYAVRQAQRICPEPLTVMPPIPAPTVKS